MNLTSDQMMTAIEHRQRLLLRGLKNFETFRELLARLVKAARIRIVFDPQSDPQLRDYLTAGTIGALEGAALGGLLGLFLGALFENESEVAAVGALLGALLGGASGVQRVEAGWRLRASWDPAGEPELLMQPI